MFDTERFIIEVQERPALYEVKSKEYANREIKAKLWMEIGQEVVAHWADLGPEEKNKAGKFTYYFISYFNVSSCFAKEPLQGH